MAYTYSPIASVTVGSGGASFINFTNIPQNYTDLILIASVRDTRNDAGAYFTDGYFSINGYGTGTSHSYRYLLGDGSGAASGNSSSNTKIAAWLENSVPSTSNTFNNVQFYIPNYTSSNNKSISIDAVAEQNATGAYVSLVAGLWSNTSAVTSIYLTPGVGNYAQYSTATLYGIRATEY